MKSAIAGSKMAFNPTPEVRAAAAFAKEFRADHVIIFFVKDDGSYGYASYGQTAKMCAESKKVADRAFKGMGKLFAEEIDY